MDRNRTVIVVVAIACATLLAIALFIWPTPYRYDTVPGQLGTVILRTNRLTGDTIYIRPHWPGKE